MNDRELESALRALHVQRTQVPDPPALHRGVLGLPLDDVAQQRSWLPRLEAGRFQFMFSATKFFVAGAIVALFGGLLLGAVMAPASEERQAAVGASASAVASADATTEMTAAASPSAVTTSDASPGLETEVVRPGIDRVLDDGAGHPLGRVRHVAAAPDGTVWAATPDGMVFEVGSPGSFSPARDGYPQDIAELVVLADGSPLVHDGRTLATWDGEVWTTQTPFEGVGGLEIRSVAQAADESLWVAFDGQEPGDDQPHLARLGPEGRTTYRLEDLGLASTRAKGLSSLAATPDGSIWAGVHGKKLPTHGLIRFDGETWRPEDPLGGNEPFIARNLEVGRDGSLYAQLTGDGHVYWHARWDGNRWTLAPGADLGVVDAGGTVWFESGQLRSWDDGSVMDYGFPGPFTRQIVDIAAGPEASLWVALARQDGGFGSRQFPGGPERGLYRIDPAIAATNIPQRHTVGRNGWVPLLHPRFVSENKLGTDIVAHVVGLGDVWLAEIDSIGRAGHRWLKRNRAGTGDGPIEAIEDALRKESGIDFPRKAAQSALLEWFTWPRESE